MYHPWMLIEIFSFTPRGIYPRLHQLLSTDWELNKFQCEQTGAIACYNSHIFLYLCPKLYSSEEKTLFEDLQILERSLPRSLLEELLRKLENLKVTAMIKEYNIGDDELFLKCPLIIAEKRHPSKYMSCGGNWKKRLLKIKGNFWE